MWMGVGRGGVWTPQMLRTKGCGGDGVEEFQSGSSTSGEWLQCCSLRAVLVQRIFKNQMVKTPTAFFPTSGLLDSHTRQLQSKESYSGLCGSCPKAPEYTTILRNQVLRHISVENILICPAMTWRLVRGAPHLRLPVTLSAG